MINLDSYFNETIDLTIKGELVKVRELTSDQVQEFVELDTLEPVDRLDEQIKLITKALNRNTSAVKFKEEEVRQYPFKLIAYLVTLFVNPNREVHNDPN